MTHLPENLCPKCGGSLRTVLLRGIKVFCVECRWAQWVPWGEVKNLAVSRYQKKERENGLPKS